MPAPTALLKTAESVAPVSTPAILSSSTDIILADAEDVLQIDPDAEIVLERVPNNQEDSAMSIDDGAGAQQQTADAFDEEGRPKFAPASNVVSGTEICQK